MPPVNNKKRQSANERNKQGLEKKQKTCLCMVSVVLCEHRSGETWGEIIEGWSINNKSNKVFAVGLCMFFKEKSRHAFGRAIFLFSAFDAAVRVQQRQHCCAAQFDF